MNPERAEILKLVGQLIMIQTRNLAGPAVPPAWINELDDPLIKALKTATFLKQNLKKQRSIADNDAMAYLCAEIKKQALALARHSEGTEGSEGGNRD